jgi:hypothetical protein
MLLYAMLFSTQKVTDSEKVTRDCESMITGQSRDICKQTLSVVLYTEMKEHIRIK